MHYDNKVVQKLQYLVAYCKEISLYTYKRRDMKRRNRSHMKRVDMKNGIVATETLLTSSLLLLCKVIYRSFSQCGVSHFLAQQPKHKGLLFIFYILKVDYFIHTAGSCFWSGKKKNETEGWSILNSDLPYCGSFEKTSTCWIKYLCSWWPRTNCTGEKQTKYGRFTLRICFSI